MERRTQALGPAEEHAGFGGRVDLAYRLEDHVPVGAAKVCGGAQTGDGVLLGVCVVDHYVCCVVCFDLGGQVLGADVSMCLKERKETAKV
jgi:hypothetical protein